MRKPVTIDGCKLQWHVAYDCYSAAAVRGAFMFRVSSSMDRSVQGYGVTVNGVKLKRRFDTAKEACHAAEKLAREIAERMLEELK